MTPQELKNSILQLAIQGKLVEQRDDEYPVELLEAANTKVDNIEYDIPSSWRYAGLERISTVVPSKEYQIKESEVIKGGKYCVISQSKEYSIGFSNDFSKLFIHKCPVIVFGDHTTVVKYIDFDFIIGADGVKIFSPNEKIIDGRFFYYILLFYSLNLGKKGEYSRHYKFIKNKPIPLPPLAEQKRIVGKIEELLPLIDRYEKAWGRLEEFNRRFPADMQKSLLQMAIQGKLVEQRAEEGTGEELYRQIQAEKQRHIKEGKIKKEKPLPEIAEDEVPFEIPESWKWVRFGELGSYKKGPFGSAITKSIFVPKGNGAIKVYEQKNAIQKNPALGNYYISRKYFEAKLKNFELFAGDIIVSCAGTIGETFVMPKTFERGIINQALMRMTVFEPIYIPYFLMYFDYVLKKTARASSKGSAIKNIPPFEILKAYLVPLPPLAEQKRIVAKLEELLPLCEKMK